MRFTSDGDVKHCGHTPEHCGGCNAMKLHVPKDWLHGLEGDEPNCGAGPLDDLTQTSEVKQS